MSIFQENFPEIRKNANTKRVEKIFRKFFIRFSNIESIESIVVGYRYYRIGIDTFAITTFYSNGTIHSIQIGITAAFTRIVSLERGKRKTDWPFLLNTFDIVKGGKTSLWGNGPAGLSPGVSVGTHLAKKNLIFFGRVGEFFLFFEQCRKRLQNEPGIQKL